jgi:hypothetical protein
MNRAVLAFLLATLAACSTPQAPPKFSHVLPSSSAIYPSPDGRLYATIRHSKQPYTVAIIERESGRVRGVAESSIIPSASGNQMHGEVRVTYSDDLSTIVVHEDFSDASPNPRYILFHRRPGATAYRVTYLAPPTAHTDAPGEFDFICPRIQRVTSDTLTLDYYDGRTRVIRISDLLQTRTPKGSQEWPSEAYKRYEQNAEH